MPPVVDASTVAKGELRRSTQSLGFLGHNPLAPASTISERLVRQRSSLGLSQKESAEHLGMDSGTLAKWERGEREPAGRFLDIVKRFLDDDGEWRSISRRAG